MSAPRGRNRFDPSLPAQAPAPAAAGARARRRSPSPARRVPSAATASASASSARARRSPSPRRSPLPRVATMGGGGGGGYGQRHFKKHIPPSRTSPGPGAYVTNASVDLSGTPRSRSPGPRMKSRVRTPVSTTPGPGAYLSVTGVPRNAYGRTPVGKNRTVAVSTPFTSGRAVTMKGKERNLALEHAKDSPGPGAYYAPSTGGGGGVTMKSRTRNLDYEHKARLPGPGAYHVPSAFGDVQPLPGQKQQRRRASSVQPRRRQAGTAAASALAPSPRGTFGTAKRATSVERKRPAAAAAGGAGGRGRSASVQRTRTRSRSQTPSARRYAHVQSSGYGRGVTMKSRHEVKPPSTPGPGAYHTQPARAVRGPSMAARTRKPIDFKNRQTPGVGTYSVSQSASYTRSTSPSYTMKSRVGIASEASRNPAPNAYVVDGDHDRAVRSTSPSFTMKSRDDNAGFYL